jgi:hypothetical protein
MIASLIARISPPILLMIAACSAGEVARPRLDYQGFAIGASEDSVTRATDRLFGSQPVCYAGKDPRFCSAGDIVGPDSARVYISTIGGAVSGVDYARRISPATSVDSLRAQFTLAWGRPDTVVSAPADETPVGAVRATPVGQWSQQRVRAWVGVFVLADGLVVLSVQLRDTSFHLGAPQPFGPRKDGPQ